MIMQSAAERFGLLEPAGKSTPRARKIVSCRMAATTAAGMSFSAGRSNWFSPDLAIHGAPMKIKRKQGRKV